MNMKTLARLLAILAPYIVGIAAAIMIIALVQFNQTQYVVKETSAYTRVSNCIVAKVAYTSVKQSDVEKCYQQVEKGSGIKLERFDTQTSTQPTNQ